MVKSVLKIIFLLFLLYVIGEGLKLYIQKSKDYKRILQDEINIQDSLKYSRDKLGREMAKSATLSLTVAEMEKVLPEVQQAIQELKIKPARVETYTETAITEHKDLVQRLRDTNIVINKVITPVKAFSYRDSWYKISGIVQSDTVTLDVSSRDTLIQVVSRGARLKPWLWFFSPRQLVQTIECRNPSNHIVFSKYIQIKK